MAEPFWKELIRQEDLEDQWDAMRDRGGDVDLDAFALARFAEARMYERARQVVERLEAQLAEARAATWQPVEDGFYGNEADSPFAVLVKGEWLAVLHKGNGPGLPLSSDMRLCKLTGAMPGENDDA